MRRKAFIIFISLYLFVAFLDYLDREGLKKGLWDNILWRDGGLPIVSLAKGLSWPFRLLPTYQSTNSKLTNYADSIAGDSQLALVGNEADLLEQICLQGFDETTMPRDEAIRFCRCVRDDVSPRLNSKHREMLKETYRLLSSGQNITEDYATEIFKSGLRDLLVAGWARCEAAFYPPSSPISVKSGNLVLVLRCDTDTGGPEIFFNIGSGELFSKKELKMYRDRVMKGDFMPEIVQIRISIDDGPFRTENWEVDLTGKFVLTRQPHELLPKLRNASTLEVSIKHGDNYYSGKFFLEGVIPPRWVPCGGISAEQKLGKGRNHLP